VDVSVGTTRELKPAPSSPRQLSDIMSQAGRNEPYRRFGWQSPRHLARDAVISQSASGLGADTRELRQFDSG
jgi:hypothetical protein